MDEPEAGAIVTTAAAPRGAATIAASVADVSAPPAEDGFINRLLMFRFLLLLQLLALLSLRGDQFVLLRFVLLVGLCIS